MHIGQIIDDGKNRWEVLEVTPRLRVLVHAVESHYFARYLDPGHEYTLTVIRGDPTSDEFWAEIPPEQMKRSVSQVLLCDFGHGPSIDLDS
jgi:hypothetical protein